MLAFIIPLCALASPRVLFGDCTLTRLYVPNELLLLRVCLRLLQHMCRRAHVFVLIVVLLPASLELLVSWQGASELTALPLVGCSIVSKLVASSIAYPHEVVRARLQVRPL